MGVSGAYPGSITETRYLGCMLSHTLGKSLTMVQYGKGEPSVPGYYSVRGEVEKAYAAIINGDDIISTLNQLNEDANAILADATAE